MNHIWIRYACKDTNGDFFFYYLDLNDLASIPTRLFDVERIWKIIGRDLWIGYKDKEGRDIYSNDIYAFPRHVGPSIGTILWSEEHCRFEFNNGFLWPLSQALMVEGRVLGNTYQNQDLLRMK